MIEIHQAKKLANLINELEGIIKILLVYQPMKDICLERIKEIKEILEEGKLRESKNGQTKDN